ncbi:MAG: serine hydrolase domain-containing protein [Bacillota bacterium]|jgi:CubicO group peptidase (beta-lactamase class C family)|nr:serine hydrolase domain-containing protein [Bacillota bacterium]
MKGSTGCRRWFWFLILSLGFFLLVAVKTGSVQWSGRIRRDDVDGFVLHLEELLPILMKKHQIPGVSLALVQDGRIVWTEAFGYADLQNGRRLTVETPLRVQSISKSVTAWGVFSLYEQGLIDLDTPVAAYLKNFSLPKSGFPLEEITVRRLLSHRAGLPLGDVFTIYSPTAEMPSLQEKLTQEATLVRHPGTAFSYSNTGYNLLELLIEELTGRDFAEYMETEILRPLGMEDASFTWSASMAPAPPTGYALDGRPVPVYVYPEKASGGLFATAEDIARFLLASMGENPVLSQDSIDLMYTSMSDKIGLYGLVFDAYGFGHYLETLPNGALSVSHGGQGSGIMTHFQAVPETGDGLVILTNSQRSWPFIACLLREWARWRGFPSVGMEKILWGGWGLAGMASLILAQSAMLLAQLFTSKPIRYRWLRVLAALSLFVLLFWSANQEYLFLRSVFPIHSVWLGGAALVFAAVLLVSALWPFVKKVRRNLHV